MYTRKNRFHALAKLLSTELKSKNISPSELAQEFRIENVEASTVARTIRKIVTGERLPPKRDKSTYLNHFAIRLEISLDKLNQAYNEDIEQSNHKMNVSDFIYKIGSSNNTDYKKTNNFINIWELKDKQTIALEGKQNLGNAMISILERLEEIENEQPSIYLTYQGRKSVFFSNYADESEIGITWRSAIESAIKKGYRFVHLIRMGDEQLRIQEIVIRIIYFISEQKGSYELRNLKDDFILDPPYGVFMVPFKTHKEAMISLSVDNSEMTDSGILTKDKEIVALIEKHIKILEDKSTQVFQRFDDYSQMFDQISEADQKPGERYIFLRRLSEITRPLEWYTPESNWARQLCAHIGLKDPEEIKKHIDNRLQRRTYLEEHLKKYPCYYIYIKSIFIQDLTISVENTETLSKRLKSNINHYFVPTDEERIQQVESILKLLSTKNFNIGLLEEDEILPEEFYRIKLNYPEVRDENLVENFVHNMKLNFCEVIDENLVFMEVPIVDDNDETKFQKRWYLTQNRIVARSFQSYFAQIWDKIPEFQKNINKIYDIITKLI